MLTWDGYQDLIAQYSEQFLDALHGSQLDSRVRSCPEWSMADLAQHLSGTQRWSTQIVRTGERAERPVGPGDREGLERWFIEGAQELVATLRAADPMAPAWNFGPQPRLAGFWSRRQAHEVAVHLWDALDAQGQALVVDAELAADGIDEVCTVFVYQKLRHSSLPQWAPILELEPTDVAAGPFVLKAPDRPLEAGSRVTLRGPAQSLLLALWGRAGIQELECVGDRGLAQAFLASGVTP